MENTSDDMNSASESTMSNGQDWGDPGGDGILADMARVFDASPDEPAIEEPQAVEPVKPAEPVEATTPEPSAIEETPILMDEEFFGADEPEPAKEPAKEGDFDEAAFDRQTEEEVKGMDAKAGEKFKALKAELKAARQTSITPEVKAKLEALELKAQEADGLRLRIDELSNVSAKLKVENDPDYSRQILEPAAEIFAKSDELAAMYSAEPAILREIIKETDRRKQNELIAKHLDEFSDFDRNEIYRMTQDFGQLVSKRGQMMSDAEGNLARMEARRAEEQSRALQEQRSAVQSLQRNIWNKYKEVIPGFTDENGEATSTYSKLMAKSLSLDFSRAKGQDQAFAAFAGMALPHVVQQVAILKKELAVYRKEDQRSVAGRPLAGSAVTSSSAEPDEDDDIISHMRKQRF